MGTQMSVPKEEAQEQEPQEEENSASEVENSSCNHFPENTNNEILLKLFSKLEEGDKPTFSRAFPQWHARVSSKRTELLIPEVAPSLVEKLPQKTLLECRKVSKSWRDEIDHQTQTHPSLFRLDFEVDAFKGHNIPQHVNRFSSAEEIQRFMEEMGDHYSENPFPGRNIRLEWKRTLGVLRTDAEELVLRREFWRNANLLLDQFGAQVHFATIDLNFFASRGIIMIKTLRDCLLRLPRLKRLSIKEATSTTSEQLVQDYFRQNPLPLLFYLETLELDIVDQAIMDQVLNACCVPTKIKCFNQRGFEDYLGLCDTAYTFENLEVLKLGGLGVSFLDFMRFINLPRLPPLREVFIDFTHSGEDDLNFEQLFMALETFRETLVHLEIMSWKVPDPLFRLGTKINLPNLKILYFFKYQGSIDPLVQLNSLENLTIIKSNMDQEDWENNLVQFYGYEKRMYESNIWSIIPTLKTLTVGSEKYWRKPQIIPRPTRRLVKVAERRL